MRKYYFLLFVFLASILSTCKKYPEGPFISFRAKEKRLLGSWKVAKYLVDGIDSTTAKYPNLSSSTCYFGFSHAAQYAGDSCDSVDGSWSFDNKRTHLQLWAPSGPKGSIFLSETISWEILKLSNKEMHLKTTFLSKQREIFAKKME